MALINCPECKKEISNTAVTCPHCGYILSNSNNNPVKPKKKSRLRLILWLIIIFLVGFIYIIISKFGNEFSSSDNNTDKMLAYNYAEDFVKQNLKSPSTAKFPSIYEKKDHVTALGNDKFKIESWVDSQNSFGGTIRTKFRCIIIFYNGKVSCEHFSFIE